MSDDPRREPTGSDVALSRDMGIKRAVCTLETSRELYPDQSFRHKLPIACEREGIKVARAHHAMGDVVMTANLWRAYYKKSPDKAMLLRVVDGPT